MINYKNKAVIGGLILLPVILVAGCHKVMGGGWIPGVNGGKATFGFQAQCVIADPAETGEEGPWFHKGQFQFNDHLAGVNFHGDMEPSISVFPSTGTCEGDGALDGIINEGTMSGACVSRPGGVQGSFSVEFVNNGTPGAGAGDTIIVSTPAFGFFGTPCTDNGLPYSNGGTVGGGNIVSVGHKD